MSRTKIFACNLCTVLGGINMSTTATIVDGKCEMSPYPCDNKKCAYYNSSGEKRPKTKQKKREIGKDAL